MKTLYLILNWLISLTLFAFSAVFIAIGYFMTSALFAALLCLTIPPVRQRIKETKLPLIKINSIWFAIIAFILLVFTMSHDSSRVVRAEKIEKQLATAKLNQEYKEKLAREFAENRDEIISTMENAIETKEFQSAIDLKRKYAPIKNQEIEKLGIRAEKEYAEHNKKMNIEILLNELKAMSEEDFSQRRTIYSKLMRFAPGNEEYRQKERDYLQKAQAQEREIAEEQKRINEERQKQQEKQKLQDMRAAIKNLCMDKWDDNYRMIDHCIENQQEAFRRVTSLMDRSKSEIQQNIIKRCMSKWHKYSDTYDWRMVAHCEERQTEAYLKIHDN